MLLASNRSDRTVGGDTNCPGTTSLVGISVPGVVVPDVTLPGNSLPGVVVSDVMLPGNSLPGDDLLDIALPRNSLPGVVVPDAALVGVELLGVAHPEVVISGVAVPDVTLPGNSLPRVDVSDVTLTGVAPLGVAESLSLFPTDLLVGFPPTIVSRASRTDSMDPERFGVAAWPTRERRASCTASMVARVTVEALPPHGRLFIAPQLIGPENTVVGKWPIKVGVEANEECRVTHTGLDNPENLVVGVWPT